MGTTLFAGRLNRRLNGGSQGKRFCLEIAHALSWQRLCTHVNCVDAVWHASTPPFLGETYIFFKAGPNMLPFVMPHEGKAARECCACVIACMPAQHKHTHGVASRCLVLLALCMFCCATAQSSLFFFQRVWKNICLQMRGGGGEGGRRTRGLYMASMSDMMYIIKAAGYPQILGF